MKLFVSFDGDHIGRSVGRARLSDNVSEIRRVSHAIDQGNLIFRSFAELSGGSVISVGGDEGCIEIPVDKLPELSAVAKQYAEAVGATVSVGVGTKLSDSAKALLVAKLRGGDQILLWQTEMEEEVRHATENPPTEVQKITDEYLGKGQAHLTGGNRGAHAGFGGYSKPKEEKLDKPPPHQRDHEQGKAIRRMIEDNRPPKPEMTHSADAAGDMVDFESQLHGHAEQQETQDRHEEVTKDKNSTQVRQQLVQILTGVKAQMPVLMQLRQASPEAFQSIMNLVQGVVLLGREALSQDPVPTPQDGSEQGVQKSEEPLEKATPEFEQWFQGSHVKSSEGAPLRVYHGTSRDQDFHTFKIGPRGAWFTSDPAEASQYAKENDSPTHKWDHSTGNYERVNQAPRVIPAYLALKNPYRMTPADMESHRRAPNYSRHQAQHFRALQSAGHDGVIFNDSTFIAFHPHQIKSAFNKTPSATSRNMSKAEDLMELVKSRSYEGHDVYATYVFEDEESAKKFHQAYRDKYEDEWKGQGVASLDGTTVTVRAWDDSNQDDAQALATKYGGKEGVEKTSAAIPGTPSEYTLHLPPGSQVNGKIRVKHGEGGESWVQARSGMVAGQDAGVPLLSANSHPVPARQSSAK